MMKDVYQKWGKPTRFLRRTLIKRQCGKCSDCKINEWELLDVFQTHRLIKDGPYHPSNCILLCLKCHTKRHKGNSQDE